MANKKQDKLRLTLFREYNLSAYRKYYRGPRKDLDGQEGYAWHSRALGRWCFIPAKQDFSLDTVVMVNLKNLRNL